MKNSDKILIKQHAVALLTSLGYDATKPQETFFLSREQTNSPLLKKTLKEQLQRINRFEYQGQLYPFSEANISASIFQLEKLAEEKTPYAARDLYNLLLLGKPFEETIDGDKKSYTLKLIDWENIYNNKFDLISDFTYLFQGYESTSDIVLFVNGIPLVVIESSLYSAQNAILHHSRNQNLSRGLATLYQFAQILIAIHPEESKYGTIDDNENYWMVWKEDLKTDSTFWNLFLLEGRLPNSADQLLYALCRPQRLLELIRRFSLYGERGKKIARYYQYFAVHSTMNKIGPLNTEGKKTGGHIRHPSGSGKLTTLLLLIRNIILVSKYRRPKLIILSNLSIVNEQIGRLFKDYGEPIEMPGTGKQLLNVLRNENSAPIGTVLQKIQTVAKIEDYQDTSSDIFIFIVEIEKMHGGALYAILRKMFPNACYIAFTHMSEPRETLDADVELKHILHSYVLKEAVQDGVLLPILYEQKKLPIFNFSLEEVFDDYIDIDTMRKWNRSQLHHLPVIEAIADDIITHYNKKWKGTKSKAMLIVSSVKVAETFHQYFETLSDSDKKIHAVAILDYEGRESEPYQANMLRQEKSNVELFIVVNKIFSGFDTESLDILYIARRMSLNHILQAIARVNRPSMGKEAGIVVDYVGLFDNIKRAVEDESGLNLELGESLKEPIVTARDETTTLKLRYKDLLQLLPANQEKYTLDILPSLLDSSDKQNHFFELLAGFERTFELVVSTEEWQKSVSWYEIDFYRTELISFHEIAQQLREAEDQNLQKTKGEKSNNPFFTPLLNLLLQHKIDLPIEIVKEYSLKILSVIEKEPSQIEAFNKSISTKLQNSWDDILIEMKKMFSLNLSYKEFDTFLAVFLKIAKEIY
jgi:type I restriction enzyme, R subunit